MASAEIVEPVNRRTLVERGWSQRRLTRTVRRGELQRVLPATFVPAGALDLRLLLRSVELHYGTAVAVLGTAASLHGLPVPWPDDGLVHVRLPPGREQVQRPPLRFHTWKLREDEVVELEGVRLTSVRRTLADLMCTYDRLSAIAAIDAALAQGLITTAEIDLLRRTTVRRRGAARSREWWSQADGRAESPLETRVRLRAIDGGFRPSELQKEFQIGGRTYRTDFAWKREDGRWLIGEADGREVHDAPTALYHDRLRSNALVGRGDIDIVRFTWADTLDASRVPTILRPLLG